MEVESGKKADRPVLAEALRECKASGFTLLVAKLDRLARNLHFCPPKLQGGFCRRRQSARHAVPDSHSLRCG